MTGRRLRGSAAPRIALAALLAASVLACTPPRPSVYRARDGAFGYSETPIGDAAWRIEFVANRATPQQTAADYALYRAAELTIAKGFERFAVTDREVERRIERANADTLRPPGFDPRERRHDATLTPADPFVGNRMVTIVRVGALLEIRLYRGAAPEGALQTFDARRVIARLKTRIRRRR